ncbi:hypothetical protein [Flavivirga spongiicola]|uniref:Uncharacterized protein n=1 Tax=Flavivirga spongiicola TaxID=421621 RepID=A0ABU7XXQ2_9FLAO|nr:hypothetical protein [Flavivirga sp. MEBiC05379]MDO5980571.1 hypothetical protein [Flavivirga sp. MEBiC05379]
MKLQNLFDRYKKENSHFQIGRHFHSNTFYLLKQFYENSTNSFLVGEKISVLINEFEIPSDKRILFVGYRSFLNLCLQNLCDNLEFECSFNTVELKNGKFQWLIKNSNYINDLFIIIILPISSSQDTYLRLYNFLNKEFKVNNSLNQNPIASKLSLEQSNNILSNEFVSILQIIDLKAIEEDSNDNRSIAVKKKYKQWGWKIEKDNNLIRFLVDRGKSQTEHISYSLLVHDRTLFPRESCELCFSQYESIVKTDDKSEDLKDLFSIGDYFKRSSTLEIENFIECFGNKDFPSILYGNVRVNDVYYNSFINCRNFYQNNRLKILEKFNRIFENLVTKEKIVLITSDFSYGSNFIGDFVLKFNKFQSKEIKILRVTLSEDYLDYYLSSLPISELTDSTIIYFEDVLSSAKNLRRISEYLKVVSSKKDNIRKGIDYIFTLIDRTNYYTHEDIKKRTNAKGKLYSFVNLNIPVTSKSHLESQTNDINNRDFELIIPEISLDVIHSRIIKLFNENNAKTIDVSRYELKNRYNFLKEYNIELNDYSIDLFKFYLRHLLNNFISLNKNVNSKEFLSDFFQLLENDKQKLCYFFSNNNTAFSKAILKFAKEQTIRLLTKHPYINFISLKKVASSYVITKMKQIDRKIHLNKGIKSFKEFREYKFFISRSVALGLDYIISKEFLMSLKLQYDSKKIVKLIKYYRNKEDDYSYEIEQITEYFSFLLYNYKILLKQDNYKSLRLEEILLSKEFQDPEDVFDFVKDSFTNFKGMLICENNSLVHSLLNDNIINNISNGKSPSKIYYSYLGDKSSTKDPIILLNKKLISLAGNPNDIVVNDGWSVTKSIGKATSKFIKFYKITNGNTINLDLPKSNFNLKIKKILNIYTSILIEKKFKCEYLFIYRSKSNFNNKDFLLCSEEVDLDLSEIKLKKSGFSNNFLSGLSEFSNDLVFSQQTLISFLKVKDDFVTYKDTLFENNDYKLSLNRSLKKDIKRLKFLGNANMLIAVKFMDNYNPEQSAVLLFYSDLNPNLNIFKQVFSDSKLRLLLALKLNFLRVLKNQFEHGGYDEYITSQLEISNSRKLDHNLQSSLSNIKYCFKKLVKDRGKTKSNVLEFDLNLMNIRSQIEEFNPADFNTSLRNSSELKDYFKLLFGMNSIGKYPARQFLPEIKGDNMNFEINDAVYYLILPEIISNMKKHSPQVNPNWEINIYKDCIVFSNSILRDRTSTNRGMSICKTILKKSGLPKLINYDQNNIHYTVLNLRK